MTTYLLPETSGPMIVQFAFHMAQIILLESALAFLSIGIPADTVSWGSMLSMARMNYQAWWLAIFPGISIFITVLVLYTIGTRILQRVRKVQM